MGGGGFVRDGLCHFRCDPFAIDGATQPAIIRWIKLPALRVAIVVSLVYSVIGSMQLFNEPDILHSLAPDTIPMNFTPNMYAYNLSFAGQEYNYSAAIAIIMGILTNMLRLNNVDSNTEMMLKAVIIIVAVWIQQVGIGRLRWGVK